jgi:hypothetical protein
VGSNPTGDIVAVAERLNAPIVPDRRFPSSSLVREEVREMSDVLSLEGPVLKRDGLLMLLIPLDKGGDEFVACSQGISEIENGFLKIVIPEWLAEMIRVAEGDRVVISNANGKFGIWASEPRPVH